MRQNTLLQAHVLSVLALGCLLCACRSSGGAPPSGPRLEAQALPPPRAAPAKASASADSVNAKSPAEAEPPLPSAAAPAAEAPSYVHYAFAKYLARAELWRGSSRLLDFGVPGDAKYTLGGWLTSAGEGRSFGETRAMYMRGSLVKLALPAEDAGARLLTLRLRSWKRTPLTVYINGKTIADRALGGSDFETVTLPLDAGVLHEGENKLELRATAALSTSANGGFAIDFIVLSDAAIGGAPQTAELAPPAPAELTPVATPDTLQLPADVRLGYACEIPEAALLTGSVRAKTPAKLVVSAVRDGAPRLALGSFDAGPEAKPLRIELAALAGQIARIELHAEGGALELQSPVIAVQAAAGTAAAQEPARKPIKNVIVMLVDTLRADKLSPYNPKTRVKTPGLERFLRSASVMLDARTQENWTKPSVATLLSSLFPWQHMAYTDDAKLPSDIETLPERLRKKGYFTGAFIANGYVSDKFGFEQGFTTYRNYIREGRPTVAQYVAADVLQWLDKRPQDKPFFLYVHTIDPHVPYVPPPHFLSMYDPLAYTGPIDFRGKSEMLEEIKIGRVKLNQRDKEHLQALYDGEISYHDVHFASIIDGLEKRGIADETMVVVTADHGEEFWDHGSVGHGHSIYDELLHIPMIVRIPGVTDGKAALRTDVGLVDVLPTVLDTLGMPMPEDISGTSFLPELLGKHAQAPRATASGFMTAWRTLAIGGVKLVQKGSDRIALYDIAHDPGEHSDIAATHPVAVRYARGMLGLTLKSSANAGNSGARVHVQEKTKIDAATEAQLRALGYVGTSRP